MLCILLKFQFLETAKCNTWNTISNKTSSRFLTEITEKVKNVFNRFIEQIQGETEAWSGRGLGWVLQRIIAAYQNVARFELFQGETYIPLPKKLKNKKAIINMQKRTMNA